MEIQLRITRIVPAQAGQARAATPATLPCPALPLHALLHTPLRLTSGKVDGGAPMRILAIDAAARSQQHLGSLQEKQVDGRSVHDSG